MSSVLRYNFYTRCSSIRFIAMVHTQSLTEDQKVHRILRRTWLQDDELQDADAVKRQRTIRLHWHPYCVAKALYEGVILC